MNNTSDWRSLPAESDATDYAHDFVSELRSVDLEATEPEETLALGAAAVETSAALTAAIAGNAWALYTPQEAAAVTASVFRQVESAAASLRALQVLLGHLAARGSAVANSGIDKRLEIAAAQLEAVVGEHAEGLVDDLLAAPRVGEPLPENVHETVVAVGRLLGDAAVLNDRTATPDHESEGRDGYGCGCTISLPRPDEDWSFSRGDSCWSLYRESDAKPLPDGGVVFSTWIDLAASSETADPRQLVEHIREVVGL